MNLRDKTILAIAQGIYSNKVNPWQFSKLHQVLLDLGDVVSKDPNENIGVGQILSSVWNQCSDECDKNAVASAFVDRNGAYPWKRENG